MNISVQQRGGVRRIEVLGDLSCRADLATLLDALSGEPLLEITFYDARTLPGRLLERLLLLAESPGRLKLRVYHNHLLHYLLRLGLNALGVLPFSRPLPAAPTVAALVLGGAAAGSAALLEWLTALPHSPAVIFVMPAALEPLPQSWLQALQAGTGYAVEIPVQRLEMCPLRPGTIYLAPPGRQMSVVHGQVGVTADRTPLLDRLLRSVAQEYREQTLAIVLAAPGDKHTSDGWAGLAAVRQFGGCALATVDGPAAGMESPPGQHSEAAAKGPAHAALLAGMVDHLLGQAELRCFAVAALAGATTGPVEDWPETCLEHLLAAVFARYGYDYRGYQRSTVRRRLEKLRQEWGAPDCFVLQREILTDPEAFERLFLELSINVTAFFRHPEQFKALREVVLPYLDSFSHIKVWSAGCANGKEAYSLAILLDELGLLHKSLIFATDINPYLLEEARNGFYPLEKFAEGERNHQASGGQRPLHDWLTPGRHTLKVAAHLREHILFYPHSLAHDGPFNEFQLILCRNVLIYFHPALQQRVMTLFSRSLHGDGFLMLGPSEGLLPAKESPYFLPLPSASQAKVYRWRHESLPQ